jgi:hypothetical protein
VALAVFAAAVGVAIVSAALRHRLDRRPFAEEASIAIHLLHGDGFSSPYDPSANAPPSCYSAPVYPLIIAAAYWLGGTAHVAMWLLGVNSICFGVIVAGIYSLGKWYVSALAGGLAALFLVIHPVLLYFVTDWWDSYVALAIFVALIVAAARARKWRHPLRGCGLMGVAMGGLSLTNPCYVLSYPLLILIGLRGRSARQRAAGIAVAVAGFAVVLTPWTLRNLEVLHRLYFVRGGLGMQMWLGNQSVSTGWLEGDMLLSSPAVSGGERTLILRLGEPEYFHLCDRRMRQEYRQAPGHFWLLTVKRLCFIFVSDPTKAYLPFPMMRDVRWKELYVDRAVLHGATALLGLAGVWTAWRLRLGCSWIFAAAFLAELPFVVSSVSDRYNLPMRVALLLFAGIFFGCVIRRLHSGAWPAARAA